MHNAPIHLPHSTPWLYPPHRACHSPSKQPSPRPNKTTYGRSLGKPTVGRLTDPLWVASTTYRRFLLPLMLMLFCSPRMVTLHSLDRHPRPPSQKGYPSLCKLPHTSPLLLSLPLQKPLSSAPASVSLSPTAGFPHLYDRVHCSYFIGLPPSIQGLIAPLWQG